MRIWHDWTHEEKELFTRFHRETNQSLLTPEELSVLKATIDIDLYCQPLSDKQIEKANQIMDSVDAAVLSRESGS